MAGYLLNEHGVIAHWPWPNKSWLYNKRHLDAINVCVHMRSLMEKQPELWTKEEDVFHTEVHEQAEDYAKHHVWSSKPL